MGNPSITFRKGEPLSAQKMNRAFSAANHLQVAPPLHLEKHGRTSLIKLGREWSWAWFELIEPIEIHTLQNNDLEDTGSNQLSDDVPSALCRRLRFDERDDTHSRSEESEWDPVRIYFPRIPIWNEDALKKDNANDHAEFGMQFNRIQAAINFDSERWESDFSPPTTYIGKVTGVSGITAASTDGGGVTTPGTGTVVLQKYGGTTLADVIDPVTTNPVEIPVINIQEQSLPEDAIVEVSRTGFSRWVASISTAGVVRAWAILAADMCPGDPAPAASQIRIKGQTTDLASPGTYTLSNPLNRVARSGDRVDLDLNLSDKTADISGVTAHNLTVDRIGWDAAGHKFTKHTDVIAAEYCDDGVDSDLVVLSQQRVLTSMVETSTSITFTCEDVWIIDPSTAPSKVITKGPCDPPP